MEKNINSNMAGLYFEDNIGIFEKRTYYPMDYNPATDTNFMSELSWDESWEDNMPPRLFWNSSLMRDPFTTDTFYYAEINHPTMGKAIFGASRNRGYVWQFYNEKDVKISLRHSFGEQYKDMLKDGYIVIKKGHNTVTKD